MFMNLNHVLLFIFWGMHSKDYLTQLLLPNENKPIKRSILVKYRLGVPLIIFSVGLMGEGVPGMVGVFQQNYRI